MYINSSETWNWRMMMVTGAYYMSLKIMYALLTSHKIQVDFDHGDCASNYVNGVLFIFHAVYPVIAFLR